jgi:flagellar basal-body rod modification protein FlgD
MTVLPANISTTTGVIGTTGTKSKSQADLNTNDFLRLMTEQLKQQDPFAPTDNTQMVAQMAQMSSSSGIAEMNASLKSISAQLSDQTALLKTLTTPAATTTPPSAG